MQSISGKSNMVYRLDDLHQQIKECTECPLHKEALQAVPGISPSPLDNIDIMFVGEGPGEEEDKTGLPFVGRAGKLFQDILVKLDITTNVYITNVVKHRPPQNRKPTQPEMQTCGLHFLLHEIDTISPKLIVCLGRTPAEYLMKILGGSHQGSLRGLRFSYMGTPVLCTWHPAYILRREDKLDELLGDLIKAQQLINTYTYKEQSTTV